MVWILFGVLNLVSPPLFSYPVPVDFSGKLLRWNNVDSDNPVLYSVRSDDGLDTAYYGSIIDEAAAMWSAVPNSALRLEAAELSETAQITVWITTSLGQSGSFSSGFSVFDEISANGNPVHCKIEMLVTSSYIPFAKTALHELGHCVGLGHSVIPEAIMSYSTDKNANALDTDDQAAITRLYPADGSNPDLPLGCSIVPGTNKGFAQKGLLLYLFLLPLGIALSFRKVA